MDEELERVTRFSPYRSRLIRPVGDCRHLWISERGVLGLELNSAPTVDLHRTRLGVSQQAIRCINVMKRLQATSRNV
ncbi:hypothetical protein MHYP_G00218770 [Metynnis hypsauchen]